MKIDVFLVISILIQMVASIHLLSVKSYCGQPPHRDFSPPTSTNFRLFQYPYPIQHTSIPHPLKFYNNPYKPRLLTTATAPLSITMSVQTVSLKPFTDQKPGT